MKVFIILLVAPLYLFAQKKPLDHAVYDSWQSIGERVISNDGKWVAYTITPQEGDADLYVRSSDTAKYFRKIPRGYNSTITEDSRFIVFRIKPHHRDTREARIKKKKQEDFPKDSIGILELGSDSILKVAKIRSYKVPEKAAGWVAYHKERDPVPASRTSPTQRTVDSLNKKIDSLVQLVTTLKNIKGGSGDATDADDEPAGGAAANEGSDLHVRKLGQGSEKLFKNVVEYHFNKLGQKLVMRTAKAARDSFSTNAVVVYHLESGRLDTILKGGNDFRNFALTEDGSMIAFVAERDTNRKALQKMYSLYLHKHAQDSAQLLVNKHSEGMQLGMTVSENGALAFSKSGNRLFFGTAPVQPQKDTSLIEIDLVKVDIWNYKDDYLQTQQLATLNNELKRSYLTVLDLGTHQVEQLGSKEFPMVMQSNEGDGKYFIAVTDTGRRVQAQWMGRTVRDVYAVEVATGKKTLLRRNFSGQMYPSSTGNYILLYDSKTRHYYAWDGKALKNVSAKITVPLYDEENDVPDEPRPYGIMGWHVNDSFVYVYDRYDIWKVDPAGVKSPTLLVPSGRSQKLTMRFVRVDTEERAIDPSRPLYFSVFDNISKASGYTTYDPSIKKLKSLTKIDHHMYRNLAKAKDAYAFLYTQENFSKSPNLMVVQSAPHGDVQGKAVQVTQTNPQQNQYNWGTAELFRWTTYNGRQSTGILYKPEDFDPKKKYPMLIYFYEKVSDNLNAYIAPAPTPSRLNIPFFVSRGYLVFTPDISYTKGHPGKDAYNYIVSGAKALAKHTWVDEKNIGIQGQSWGGYQVAHLITATNMFKAAWAGAPVVNMFSAYGGIRWETGLNRQFQYEKTQSRIGATPWERHDLYIENSPFFHLPKVKTPVVIMANDADGAVPWYQGIEMFTALRRLNKPVWMLNYNGEAHNLVERKNRKDISIRQQQFFDWLLKGEKPAKWLTEGVPAVNKGKDWGLELADQSM